MKKILLFSLLLFANHAMTQDSCKVFQYTLNSDTTVGLTIYYDTFGNVSKEIYTEFKHMADGWIGDEIKYYYYLTDNQIFNFSKASGTKIYLFSIFQYNLPPLEKIIIETDIFDRGRLDTITIKFKYDKQHRVTQMSTLNKNSRYDESYYKFSKWGLSETYYTYSDSLLIKEEYIRYVGRYFRDGSRTKKVITKTYSYDGLICTVKEKRHEYALSNPYRKITTIVQYKDYGYSQILSSTEYNRKNEFIEEIKYTYYDDNKMKSVVISDGFSNKKLWSYFIYYD